MFALNESPKHAVLLLVVELRSEKMLFATHSLFPRDTHTDLLTTSQNERAKPDSQLHKSGMPFASNLIGLNSTILPFQALD